ncbi:ABC transporter permease [Albidovulum sp.]|uniref:ABC transporter permease n=1 Tax=Albidovulum sp. TaxID=1872424 RepID=UPI0039B9743C
MATAALRRRPALLPVAAAAALAALALALGLAGRLPDWAWRIPSGWEIDLATGLNRFFKWLTRAGIGPLTVKDVTRGIGAAIEVPLDLVRGVLAEGFRLRLPGGARAEIAALPWWALTAVWTLLAQRIGGRGGALLVLGSCLYFLVLDLWEPAMLTLASVALSVAVGAAAGLLFGAWAYRWPRLDAGLTVAYDIMQTLPVFSYLVPILLFFGFGPVAALTATVVYAMPPMARNTTLALRRLPQSANDLATVTGCTPRQRQWLVLLPAARHGLLVGLNQVIMLSLSAVIIASIIGAGGLGNDVLQGLKSMRLGRAFEAGLGITLLAIVLDRLSRALALRHPAHRAGTGGKLLWATLGLLVLGQFAAQVMPAARDFPEALTLSTGRALDDLVAWANLAMQGPIEALRDMIVRYLLRPVKEAALALPWLAVAGGATLVATAAQGPRLAFGCAATFGFIALTGYWDQAMISLYLVLVSTLVAMVLGVPVGLIAGLRPSVDRAVTLVIDMLQTLPSFVYLIPVVMLFGLGDFPALVAIVLYALPPAIRYTKDGIARVPRSLVEAADMAGCSPRQRLAFVQIPHALPELMLGLNQTLLMAFGMLVITSLVGTRGLEQEALVAVSKAKVGEGLVAGLGISFLSIVADRLIGHGARRLRQRLGQRLEQG